MNEMTAAEVRDHLWANLPSGSDYLATLDDGTVSVRNDDERWGHCSVTVQVEPRGQRFAVCDDGWVTGAWLGVREDFQFSARTNAAIDAIATREGVTFDGACFSIDGLALGDLSDAVVRLLRCLHDVVDLDPQYANRAQLAATD